MFFSINIGIMFNGERIKEIITEKGMTQTQVANAMSMSLSSFGHMIGPNGNPSAKNIELIAETLEVPIQELFVSGGKYEHPLDVESKLNDDIQYKYSQDAGSIELLKKIIETKDDLISEKEKLVKEKERVIQILLRERGL